MILNRFSLTRSVIGRVVSPGTSFIRIPRALPAMILGIRHQTLCLNRMTGSQNIAAGRSDRCDTTGSQQKPPATGLIHGSPGFPANFLRDHPGPVSATASIHHKQRLSQSAKPCLRLGGVD